MPLRHIPKVAAHAPVPDGPEPVRHGPRPPGIPVPATTVIAYDTETTGKDETACQITQFAALLCDQGYNRVASVDIQVALLPYVIPSPGALLVTRTDPNVLTGPGRLDEYDASRMILDALNPPGAGPRVMVTFNGIKFDDEVIRRMAFRNMLDHLEFMDGVTRVDLLHLSRAIFRSSGGSLKEPVPGPDGKSSHRLGDVCAANGIDIVGAHEAGADVAATMDLADLIRTNDPWAWELALACGSMAEVMRHLPRHGAAWIVDTKGNSPSRGATPFAYLGPAGKKMGLFVEANAFYGGRPLPVTLPSGREMRYGPPREASDHAGEPPGTGDGRTQPWPIRLVPLNKSVLILRGPEDVERYVCEDDASAADRMADGFLHDPARQADVRRLRAHAQAETKTLYDDFIVDERDSDACIYKGEWLSPTDKQNRDRFREADTLNTMCNIEFRDKRMRDFAARIMLRLYGFDRIFAMRKSPYAADCLQAAEHAHSRAWLDDVPAGDKGWTTARMFREEAEGDEAMLRWLDEHRPAPPFEDAGLPEPDDVEEETSAPGMR